MLSRPNQALPTRMRDVRAVLSALGGGPLTISQLAERGGVDTETAATLLPALARSGVVQRLGSNDARAYELMRLEHVVIGVDLGGTKVHLALSDMAGGILAEEIGETDARGGLHVADQIVAMADRLRRQAGCKVGSCRVVAIGSAGVLDPRSGSIQLSPNIPGLGDINVVELLQQKLGCPIVVENDVNLGALGEQWHGSCVGEQNFAFVALGTGIGMGLVIDGCLVRGAHGAAGEIAYLPIGSHPFSPESFLLGPLETAIGSVGILRHYQDHPGSRVESVRAVFDRAVVAEPAAIATLDYVAHLLLQALVTVRAVVDPTLFVLGGSIGVRPELLERLRAAMAPLPFEIIVRQSALGSRAVLIGATSLAITEACRQISDVE